MRFQFDSGDGEGWLALAIVAVLAGAVVLVELIAAFVR